MDLFLLLTGVLPFQVLVSFKCEGIYGTAQAPTPADPCFEVVIQGHLSQLLRYPFKKKKTALHNDTLALGKWLSSFLLLLWFVLVFPPSGMYIAP